MTDIIGRVRCAMTDAQADTLILVPGSTLHYITGFHFETSERLTLVGLRRDGKMVAVLPNFEVSNWTQNVSLDAEIFAWDDTDGPSDAVARALDALGDPGSVAIEALVMRVFEKEHLEREFGDARFVSAEGISQALRASKSAEEIDAMRRAIAIAEQSLEELLATVRVGVTEQELEARLSAALLSNGGGGISFGPIVLSGPKAALPHGVPDERAIRASELLLIDFGTDYHGYHCDITRTFVVGAEPDDRTRTIYEAVQRGNAAGCAKCGPGVTSHDVHHAAQDGFDAPEFGDYMTHRTGHGLGLEVHEPPSVMDGNHTPLAAGNVITVEPGLYAEGWGGVRIEDDVLITETGCEILTTFPRELRVIG